MLVVDKKEEVRIGQVLLEDRTLVPNEGKKNFAWVNDIILMPDTEHEGSLTLAVLEYGFCQWNWSVRLYHGENWTKSLFVFNGQSNGCQHGPQSICLIV